MTQVRHSSTATRYVQHELFPAPKRTSRASTKSRTPLIDTVREVVDLVATAGASLLRKP